MVPVTPPPQQQVAFDPNMMTPQMMMAGQSPMMQQHQCIDATGMQMQQAMVTTPTNMEQPPQQTADNSSAEQAASQPSSPSNGNNFKVYLHNLPEDAEVFQIQSLLGMFGGVISVDIVKQNNTAIGVIAFRDKDHAQNAAGKFSNDDSKNVNLYHNNATCMIFLKRVW